MVDKKSKKQDQEPEVKNASADDEGEYGVEQVLADPTALEEARKHSTYHFTHDQLQHKDDRIDINDRE